MEFGMSRRIKPKQKYVRISMKEIWRNLYGPPKNKELWIYVVKFEFSRPKSSSENSISLNPAFHVYHEFITQVERDVAPL